MEKTQKKKKSYKKIGRIITFILLIIVLILFGMIFSLNIIPLIYTIIAFILALGIVFVLLMCNLSRKKGFRIIGYFFSILIILTSVIGEFYLYNTLGFLFSISDGNYEIKNYSVMVLKTNDYNKISDLENEKVGLNASNSDELLKKAQDKIKKKVHLKYTTLEDLNTLIDCLMNNEVAGIILEKSELDLLKEEDSEKFNNLKEIYKVEVKGSIKDLQDQTNINEDSFNIYISGIDTFGKINSSSRSDVNMVVSINPKTEKILITWIPRDYYVFINNSNYKDKLTHAGIYGIDSSIYAAEKLLNIDINYYVKVNFTSVIKVVDILGGITVYNEEAFTGYDVDDNFKPYYFKKGNITLKGKEALVFVRERHHVTGGDLGRGKNQVKVLEALMKKAMSKDIIKKYNSLLNSLNGAFVTNMSTGSMTSFIKKELVSPRDWQITSNTLTGIDASEYTYTYKKTKLYVMKPKEESVNTAKQMIQEVLKNNE